MPFQAQKQSIQSVSLPAPIGGIDATQNMSVMDNLNCIYTYNLMPKEFGMTVREGYREYANGTTGVDGIRTMIGFYGLAQDESEDRLFAATNIGIYDVSTDGDIAPTLVVTWPIQGAGAGHCIFVQYTSLGGAYLLLADGDNGYWTYDGDTQTWTQILEGVAVGEISGVNPADFAFVTVWKNRVWFVEKNSGAAWYLPTGQITGVAVAFEFGNKFRYGGHLVGLWNWTLDGGDGVDDHLVAISEGGDVIVYRGTDPAQISSFDQVGSWFVGAMPAGRRVASDFGGDLLVLSVFGVVSMSGLLSGSSGMDRGNYLTDRIAPYVRNIMNDFREEQGWEINSYPREGLTIIDTPTLLGRAPIQFVFDISTQAWGIWRDVPLATMTPWHGNFYFGSQDIDRVWVFQGDIDQVYLDPDTDGPGLTINWSMLSAYSSLDAPSQQKLMQLLRPVFNSQALPAFEILARYDFDLAEIPTGPIFNPDSLSGTWDVSTWDLAVWGGGTVGADNPGGASGIGRYVAIALRGSSANKTTLLATDVAFTVGGLM